MDSTSYSSGGISSNKFIRRIAVQNYTRSAVGGSTGRLIIETDGPNDGANFGVRQGNVIVLTSTSVRVADGGITVDSNGGSFSVKLGLLDTSDINGQALDELFGRQDGCVGWSQANYTLYVKHGRNWYSLPIPSSSLRTLS